MSIDVSRDEGQVSRRLLVVKSVTLMIPVREVIGAFGSLS
jgi:hypothetical protein